MSKARIYLLQPYFGTLLSSALSAFGTGMAIKMGKEGIRAPLPASECQESGRIL